MPDTLTPPHRASGIPADRTGPVRTLHIDIEGGLGGSSRSLFELVSRLDPARISPFVIYRVEGPIAARYEDIGVPTACVPEIFSFAPRKKKSLNNFVGSLPRMRHIAFAADRIAELARHHNTEVVHLNYEGLFLMAPMIRRRLNVPIVAHSRTQIPDNLWGRWEARTLARHADFMFFISPMEEANFRRHADVRGEVLWNIASPPPRAPEHPSDPVAVYLGNIDHTKGTDRLLDIAEALERINAPSLRIAVFGSARNEPEYLTLLQKRIADKNLQYRISFEGRTDCPERVLSTALALIRPSRWNDPWGRDVIEATRAGIPVLATGTMDGVVELGRTGFLFFPFDADAMARTLVRLATDSELWESCSRTAREKGERIFSGVHQTERVQSIFEELAGGRPQSQRY